LDLAHDARQDFTVLPSIERQNRTLAQIAPVAVMETVLGLYRDRGSHFWLTPKAGGAVDPQRPTQVGRALRDLGIQMIPAYSPQARGRSERNFGTWQGRLPQELRIHGIKSLDAANAFLRERYIAEFNQRFQVAAAERGSAFLPRRGQDLERVFSLQWERTVNRDNTVTWQNLTLQIERVKWRATLTGCTVTVHQHLDATLSLRYGPHCLGRYSAQGVPANNSTVLPRDVEKTAETALENAPRFPLSHNLGGSTLTNTGHSRLGKSHPTTPRSGRIIDADRTMRNFGGGTLTQSKKSDNLII